MYLTLSYASCLLLDPVPNLVLQLGCYVFLLTRHALCIEDSDTLDKHYFHNSYSFPGRAGEGKNGLVSIVCACAGISVYYSGYYTVKLAKQFTAAYAVKISRARNKPAMNTRALAVSASRMSLQTTPSVCLLSRP